jgi:DNA-binding transcriptional LysR family regulator
MPVLGDAAIGDPVDIGADEVDCLSLPLGVLEAAREVPVKTQVHDDPVRGRDLFESGYDMAIRYGSRAEWRFEGDDSVTVRVSASFITNDGGAAHSLALEGAGIAVKSIWDVGDDIVDGRLCRVLPVHSMSAAPLHAIYPHSQHLAPRVRAFVDYLRERLQASWRW